MQLDDSAFVSIGNSCHRLTELRLNCCIGMSDISLKAVNSFSSPLSFGFIFENLRDE